MKKLRYKRKVAFLLGLMLSLSPCVGNLEPAMVSYAYTARTATVNATNLNVRSGPGTSYSVVAKLSRGTGVTVINEANASDGALWYQIRFAGSNGAEVTGYVSNSYLKFPVTYNSDADFEAYLNAQGFPESYKPGLRQLHAQYPNWVFTAQKINLDWNTVIQNEAVLPRSLVHTGSISSWKSTADGAFDWSSSTWPGFDGASWVAASEDIIRYYMDPRNFLDDTYIFQFLLHTYDSSVHTKEGVASQIKGSFLENSVPGAAGSPGGGGSSPGDANSGIESGSSIGPGGSSSGGGNSGNSGSSGAGPGGSTPSTGGGTESNTGSPGSSSGNISLEAPGASVSKKYTDVLTTSIGPGAAPGSTNSSPSGSPQTSGSSSYVDIIMNAAVQSGVNPYVLAAMIIQEQGKGTSPLISGSYAGYEGYYNYFNVGAFQTGSSSAIQSGLLYASQSGSYGRPWNTPEKSIIGGAMYYGDSYVKAGQDTFYLKKFNVQGNNLYKHQYMTNIQGAASEAAIYSKAYSAELKNTALEFKIPVYNNMPDQACSKPQVDGSPNNKLSSLSVNGFSLTPTFNRDTQSYDLIVDTSVTAVTINASAIDSKAKITGSGNNQLQVGNNDIKVSVQAENGSVRDYIIHVVRQNNGPLDNGSVNPGDSGNSNSGNSPSGIGPGGTSGPGAGSNTDNGSSKAPSSGTPSSGTPGGSQVTIFPQGTEASKEGMGTVTIPGGDFSQISVGGGPGGGTDTVPQESQASDSTAQESQSPGEIDSAQNSKIPAVKTTMGDINGDGTVTVADLIRLQRHILGLEVLSGQNQLAADLNGDKKLDVKDVVLLQRAILDIR